MNNDDARILFFFSTWVPTSHFETATWEDIEY